MYNFKGKIGEVYHNENSSMQKAFLKAGGKLDDKFILPFSCSSYEYETGAAPSISIPDEYSRQQDRKNNNYEVTLTNIDPDIRDNLAPYQHVPEKPAFTYTRRVFTNLNFGPDEIKIFPPDSKDIPITRAQTAPSANQLSHSHVNKRKTKYVFPSSPIRKTNEKELSGIREIDVNNKLLNSAINGWTKINNEEIAKTKHSSINERQIFNDFDHTNDRSMITNKYKYDDKNLKKMPGNRRLATSAQPFSKSYALCDAEVRSDLFTGGGWSPLTIDNSLSWGNTRGLTSLEQEENLHKAQLLKISTHEAKTKESIPKIMNTAEKPINTSPREISEVFKDFTLSIDMKKKREVLKRRFTPAQSFFVLPGGVSGSSQLDSLFYSFVKDVGTPTIKQRKKLKSLQEEGFNLYKDAIGLPMFKKLYQLLNKDTERGRLNHNSGIGVDNKFQRTCPAWKLWGFRYEDPSTDIRRYELRPANYTSVKKGKSLPDGSVIQLVGGIWTDKGKVADVADKGRWSGPDPTSIADKGVWQGGYLSLINLIYFFENHAELGRYITQRRMMRNEVLMNGQVYPLGQIAIRITRMLALHFEFVVTYTATGFNTTTNTEFSYKQDATNDSVLSTHGYSRRSFYALIDERDGFARLFCATLRIFEYLFDIYSAMIDEMDVVFNHAASVILEGMMRCNNIRDLESAIDRTISTEISPP
jgi:hypothetical protein